MSYINQGVISRMNGSPQKNLGFGWFRWLPVSLLILGIIYPIAEFIHIVFYQYGSPNLLLWVILSLLLLALIIITSLVWLKPVLGGILAILSIPVGLYIAAVMLIGIPFEIRPFIIESVIVGAGGILAIVWGIRRRMQN